MSPVSPGAVTSRFDGAVLALSGGVGGAKLALGLSAILPGDRLLVAANTGDDFEHLGLSISPDIDTLLYTLAGLSNEELGWGRKAETWTFMAALEALGGETWFRLGDGDLATHAERTRRLKQGETLSEITAFFCRKLGISARIVPMTDDRVRTRLRTAEIWLDFQDYFVRRQCRPVISAIEFDGIDQAQPHPDLIAALNAPGLRAIVICPSNPFISVEPILNLPNVRSALAVAKAPVIAVSPIIGGKAVKGPTGKMMTELGLDLTNETVLQRYDGLLDALVIDQSDADDASVLTVPANILMKTLDDKIALATTVLQLADEIAAGRRTAFRRRA